MTEQEQSVKYLQLAMEGYRDGVDALKAGGRDDVPAFAYRSSIGTYGQWSWQTERFLEEFAWHMRQMGYFTETQDRDECSAQTRRDGPAPLLPGINLHTVMIEPWQMEQIQAAWASWIETVPADQLVVGREPPIPAPPTPPTPPVTGRDTVTITPNGIMAAVGATLFALATAISLAFSK